LKPRWILGATTLVALAAAAAWAKFGPGDLTINGNTVTTNFIVQGGKTYVPLADVAKVLGGNVLKTDAGFSIIAGGGAMVNGTIGNLGQTLTGKGVLFTVSKEITGDHYKKQFNPGAVDPLTPEATIVAFNCRIRNTGTKTISPSFFGGDKTALADTDEHTYAALTGSYSDIPGSSDILPGAVADFVLTFNIPKTAVPKALVYETGGFIPPNIFRITLPPPAPAGH
jgi:hypothetical protein